MIASSHRDELSWAGSPYSVFTQALREALAGYGAAERDGYARVADIAMYLSRTVPARTQERQHPVLKLAQADNFAVAYYAAGASAPKALPGAQGRLLPIEHADAEIVEGYRQVLKTYQRNLLIAELRMAEFFDQLAVPPDLIRTRAGILQRIAEIEATLERSAETS